MTILSSPARGELREPDALRIADLLERAGVIEDKTGEIRYGDPGRYINYTHFSLEPHYQLQV